MPAKPAGTTIATSLQAPLISRSLVYMLRVFSIATVFELQMCEVTLYLASEQIQNCFSACALREIAWLQPHWTAEETHKLSTSRKICMEPSQIQRADVFEKERELKITYFLDYRKNKITFSHLGTQTLNASIVLYGFFLCAQTVDSRNDTQRNTKNKIQTNFALDCFFRWKPAFSKKPALILRFWLARLDPRYVTFPQVTDVNYLECRLFFLTNHKYVDWISGNPLSKVLSRVFSLPTETAFSFDCVMGYFYTTCELRKHHALTILRKCGRHC